MSVNERAKLGRRIALGIIIETMVNIAPSTETVVLVNTGRTVSVGSSVICRRRLNLQAYAYLLIYNAGEYMTNVLLI